MEYESTSSSDSALESGSDNSTTDEQLMDYLDGSEDEEASGRHEGIIPDRFGLEIPGSEDSSATDSEEDAEIHSRVSDSDVSSMDAMNEQISKPKKKKRPKTTHDFPTNNPSQRLSEIFMSRDMADLNIKIDGHFEIFKVHSLVLGMSSDYFKVRLFGPLAEKDDTITLKEATPQALRWILEYMYTGQTRLPSVEMAVEVYKLADYYLMDHLKIVCSEVVDVSSAYFFSSPTIGSLNSDSLELLLKKDLPVSSESVIFKGIITWARAHLKVKEEDITGNTLRQEVENFLPHVRFLTMSLEEFMKYVVPEDILTSPEVTAIKNILAGVTEVSLPSLFSTKKEHRNRFHISRLKICYIKTGHSGGILRIHKERATDNLVILSKITCVNIIYLSKLEYEFHNGYHRTLTVMDSYKQELQSANFDGQVAQFGTPLKMLPGERYTFTLSLRGNESMCSSQYTIADNGLISGLMNNFNDIFILHYWI